jgi:crotonobetainyl-CoA:carnitine CoA-transferase CaiB-like acyl-CoA transferase
MSDDTPPANRAARRAGRTAGLLAAALLAFGPGVAAARCASVADQQNFEVEALKTELMLMAVSSECRREADYNAFINRFRQELIAADGHVVVATGTNKTYREFCVAIGDPGLADDPLFATNQTRVRNRQALVERLSAVFRQKTTAQWITLLEKADVPCAPVNDLQTAFGELEATSPGMTQRIDHPGVGSLSQLGVPFHFSNCAGDLRRPPPMLGEHTEQVLADLLGRSPAQIAQLREAQVI